MASTPNTPTARGSRNPQSTATPSPATWTTQQIHANAANWSLQGDAQLLQIMQNLSQHLDQRCSGTRANIDRMQHALDGANLRLENTVNKMLSLKNLQFIEARVRDDVDVANRNTASAAGASSTDARKPALTAELAIRAAFDNGLGMLDRCYEKVTLQLDDDSDAEDEVDEAVRQASIVFRARNPHQSRPLPHLIGSREWTDKWHVGLVESDDGDDGDDDDDDVDVGGTDDGIANRPARSQVSRQVTAAEEYSSSEDDTISMSVSLPSNAQTGTGSENSDSQRSSARPSLIANQPDVDRTFDMLRPGADLIQPTKPADLHRSNPSNLFDESDSEDSATVLPVPVASGKSAVEAQRVRVLPALPTTSSVTANAGGAGSTRRVDNVSAPAPMFRQPVQQSRPAQTSAATLGLFDDEPPELDAPSVASRKPVNLFLDDSDEADDDTDFVASTKPTTSSLPVYKRPVAQPTAAAQTINVPAKTSNLFDSTDSEPEAYVPESKPGKIVTSVEKPLAKSNIHNLFDDSPPDDLFDQLMSTNKKSSAVKTNIFADDGDELFGDSASGVPPQNSIVNNPVGKVLQTKKPVQVTSTIEANNYVDDSKKGVPSSAEPSTTSKNNIFDGDYDDLFTGKDVSSAPTSKHDISKSTIFDDDNDLFNNVQKDASNVKPVASSATQKSAAKTTNIFDDIFGDEPPEDDFASIFAKPKPTLTVPLNKKSLFESDSNDSADGLEPQTTKKNEPSNIPSSIDEVMHNPTPVVSSDQPTENVASKPNTPERYANFYATNNSTENGSKRVEDRRPFVSYLDNDSPPDFDEWGSNNDGDLFVSANKELAEQENSIIEHMVKKNDNYSKSDTILKNEGIVTNSHEPSHDEMPSEILSPKLDAGSSANENQSQTPSVEELGGVDIREKYTDEDFLDKQPTLEKADPKKEIVSHVNIEPINSGSNEGLNDAEKSIQPVEPPIDDHRNLQPTIASSSSAFLFDDEPPEDDFQDIFSAPAAEKSSEVMSNFFDEMPPDDDPFEQKAEPAVRASPSTHTNSVALFDDEPPEDETFEKQKEPSTSIATNSPFSAGLFDDLPPDDDEMYAPATSRVPKTTISDGHSDNKPSKPDTVYAAPDTTSVKKMYYEDFDDTIVVPTPPANNVSKSVSAGTVNPTSDLLKTKLNKFTQPPAVDMEPVVAANKPKPKKLNTNIQINVAALLPGAKRTNASKLSSPKEEDVTDKQSESDALNSKSMLTNTSVPEVSTGLLVGLNKGRAKIAVKRRPSTRTGRQNEYRKSLLANGEMQIDGVGDHTPHEPNPISVQPAEKSFAEMLQSDNEEDDWLSGKTVTSKEAPVKSTSAVSVDKRSHKDDQLITPKSTVDAQTKTSVQRTSANLFDADDDDDDDLFGAATRKQPTIKTTPATIQPKVPSVNNATINVSKEMKMPTSRAGSSLFGDAADDDDDLFATKPIRSKAISNNKQNVSLFGDSDEDDDDDLFGASKKTTSAKGSSKAPSKANATTSTSVAHDPLADLWKGV